MARPRLIPGFCARIAAAPQMLEARRSAFFIARYELLVELLNRRDPAAVRRHLDAVSAVLDRAAAPYFTTGLQSRGAA